LTRAINVDINSLSWSEGRNSHFSMTRAAWFFWFPIRLPQSMMVRAIPERSQRRESPMADDPLRTKPEPPPPQAGSIISLADRDRERRHAAARRLAERHNAALRPRAPLARADEVIE
jgi:hypothetical protein